MADTHTNHLKSLQSSFPVADMFSVVILLISFVDSCRPKLRKQTDTSGFIDHAFS